jgi:anti-sigma factor RsiW
MRCQRVIEILAAHAGEIPTGSSAQAVREHLQTCPTCAHWEQTMRAAIQIFGAAADVEVPGWLRSSLEEKIRERDL